MSRDETFQFKVPNEKRHLAAKVTQSSLPRGDGKNTVILDWNVVKSDIEIINAGKAVREGNRFTVDDRVYETDDLTGDHIFPVSGSGFYQLSRQGFKALGLFNSRGEAAALAQINHDPAMRDNPDVAVARQIWELLKK